MDEKEKKQYQLQKFAGDLLEHQNYKTYFEMVANGYQPTHKQEKDLHDIFLRSKWDDANALMELGYKPDIPTLSRYLLYSNFLEAFSFNIKAYRNSKIYKNYATPFYQDDPIKFIIHVSNTLEQPDAQQELYDLWEKAVTSKKRYDLSGLSEQGAIKMFEMMNNAWFQDKSLDDYKSLIQKIEKSRKIINNNYEKYCLNVLPDIMSASIPEIFSKTTERVIQETKQLYINNVVDNIVVQSQYEKSKEYHIKNLPQEVQDIIMKIEKKYTRVSIMMENLEIDKKTTVTKLMKERLPEVVRKYFSIDEDYRTTLKNHEGKYPKELLMDSLNQIHDVLKHVLDQVNEDKVNKLTVDNRYMHEVKKSF